MDWADVTSQVRKQVTNQRLSFPFPSQGADPLRLGFPHPAPNRHKAMVILYAVDGKPARVFFSDVSVKVTGSDGWMKAQYNLNESRD